MHFPTLVAQSNLPADVTAIVEDLLARKAVTRELGEGPLPTPIGALIDDEFTRAREQRLDEPWRPAEDAVEAANRLFRHWVLRERS